MNRCVPGPLTSNPIYKIVMAFMDTAIANFPTSNPHTKPGSLKVRKQESFRWEGLSDFPSFRLSDYFLLHEITEKRIILIQLSIINLE